jgi:hypothetical protein
MPKTPTPPATRDGHGPDESSEEMIDGDGADLDADFGEDFDEDCDDD